MRNPGSLVASLIPEVKGPAPQFRLLILVLALVMLCAGLAQTSPGHALLADAGLYAQPASYTELTFTTPGDLPSALPSANSSVDVAFTIHNVSAASRVYQWSVALAEGGRSHVMAAGTAGVAAQGRVAVTRRVPAQCAGGRLQVLVRLARPAESANFWVACPASVQGAR